MRVLRQLEIHNVALIEKISLELGEGLNILTGETGAGKSIIIDSINAILGDRLTKEIIRTGREKALVEAVFQTDDDVLAETLHGVGIETEEDGTLIVSREFCVTGKNTCRINGKMVTLSVLKEIGERLIDIHGQHDNQSLLRTDSHIGLLDSFGGKTIELLKIEYLKLLNEYKEINSRLRGLTGGTAERERKIDLLKFQIDEIKKAKLKEAEEEELNKKRSILANSEKIINSLSSAYEALFDGNNIKSSASDCINEAVNELRGIDRLDNRCVDIRGRLEDISFQLDDISEDIRKERDNVEYNPDLLEEIEERIDLIYKLKRKYGSDIREILEFCRKAEIELDEIIRSGETVNSLQKQLTDLDAAIYGISKRLNAERVKAAGILENAIGLELEDLDMKKAQFKVNIEFNYTDENTVRKYTQNGLDRVEFLISPNPGEPLKPLSKIASGGEMSRIMLAIKTILANVDRIPTMIFDEIDIGISGRAAQKVGEKLSYISKGHQVLCVTHLAQIACMSDSHYLIEKTAVQGSTHTKIEKLEGKKITTEIARMITGANISEITLKHAEEMLETAKIIKKRK